MTVQTNPAITEIVSTQVRMSPNSGESVWLDGGKLLRGQYEKGDTLEISTTENSVILRRMESLPRSTKATHNVSGRKSATREQIMPLLELPLKKSGMNWQSGTPLKVKITTEAIVIQVNNFLLERRKRAAKFLNMINTRRAKHLDIEVSDTPLKPMENTSEQSDLCTFTFDSDLNAKPTSAFYNALRSVEESNPLAVLVKNSDAPSNSLGQGIITILKNMEYVVFPIVSSWSLKPIGKGYKHNKYLKILEILKLTDRIDVTGLKVQIEMLESQGYEAVPEIKDLIAVSEDINFDTATLTNYQPTISMNTTMDMGSLFAETKVTSYNFHFDHAFDLDEVNSFKPTYGKLLCTLTDRAKNLNIDLTKGQLSIASFFHGGGSFEVGFTPVVAENGLTPKLALVSEIEDVYLQHSFEANAHAFTPSTIVLSGDMCHFRSSNCPVSSSMMVTGLSCTGASRAGISKGGYGIPELHDKAGHLFWPTLKYLVALAPYYYVMENTDSYKSTASFKSIILVLQSLDYQFEDGILDSHNLGATESRSRVFVIATSDATPDTITQIAPFSKSHHFVGPRRCISMLLDDSITENSKMYRSYDNLKNKALKDKAQGKGFGRHVYQGHETRSLVIRAQYIKAGSSDCYHRHPSNPELSRLYSPIENARLKGFSDEFVTKPRTNAATTLHMILGQGIPRPVSAFVGSVISKLALSYKAKTIDS